MSVWDENGARVRRFRGGRVFRGRNAGGDGRQLSDYNFITSYYYL